MSAPGLGGAAETVFAGPMGSEAAEFLQVLLQPGRGCLQRGIAPDAPVALVQLEPGCRGNSRDVVLNHVPVQAGRDSGSIGSEDRPNCAGVKPSSCAVRRFGQRFW